MRFHCQKGIKIPNNRSQALKRMHQLKRRLKKDSSFFQDYQCFMDDLVANGFSRKATSPSTDDSTWYLPHHGVYHPCKPGKIRVRFDCSAEFDGTSLNKELLPGTDLISQLVGVLTRLRIEEADSWLILKLCFTKCTSLKRKEAFLGTCGGRMLIWKNLLIMKCVYMYLVGHHPLDVVTMLYEEQLWTMFQLTVNKRLISSWDIFMWMMC